MPATNTYTSLTGETGRDVYSASHINPEGDYPYRLYRATNTHTIYGRMASGHLQDRFLKMPVQMIRPKGTLEVGAFSRHSAIYMVEGLEKDGELYIFEISDEVEGFAHLWIEGSSVVDRIDLRISDTAEEVSRLGILFDMAFVDGDRRDYAEVYEKLLPIVRSGDYILTDNTP